MHEMNKLSLYIGTSNFSSANHPKKHPNIQNIFSRSERKLSKSYFLNMYGHSKWSPHNFKLDPLDPFKFLEKVFAKALFLKSFLVCNFWKMWFWFFLTDPSVEHILIWYLAYLWSLKRCRTKFWDIWRSYMSYKI